MGSTLSHFKQRSSVFPVRSVIAIKSFLHFGQRCSFMASFAPVFSGKFKSRKPKGKCLLSLKKHCADYRLPALQCRRCLYDRCALSAKPFRRSSSAGVHRWIIIARISSSPRLLNGKISQFRPPLGRRLSKKIRMAALGSDPQNSAGASEPELKPRATHTSRSP